MLRSARSRLALRARRSPAARSGRTMSHPSPPSRVVRPVPCAARRRRSTPSPLPADWWRLYDDPVLDGLVADALAANTDVAPRSPGSSAPAPACAARAPTGCRRPAIGARRDLWPPACGPAPARAPTARTGASMPASSVSYELDLFGRVSRVDRGRARRAGGGAGRCRCGPRRRSSPNDRAGLCRRRLGRGAAARRATRSSRCSTSRCADRAAARCRARPAGLDVAHIAALRDQRRREIPALEAERQAALFRLATLTGRAPGRPAGDRRRAQPRRCEIDQPIPVGDGAALLARRPDVRAAERRLAADTARIGVATAELYPRITLGGSIGSTGPGLGDLFGGGPLRWLLGPLLSWAFPNQDRPARASPAAEADTQGALAGFDGTVLLALEETETALSQLRPRARAPRRAAERARAGRDARPHHPRAAARRQHRFARRSSMPNAPSPKPKPIWLWPTRGSPTRRSTCSGRWAGAGRTRRQVVARRRAARSDRNAQSSARMS